MSDHTDSIPTLAAPATPAPDPVLLLTVEQALGILDHADSIRKAIVDALALRTNVAGEYPIDAMNMGRDRPTVSLFLTASGMVGFREERTWFELCRRSLMDWQEECLALAAAASEAERPIEA